MKALKNLSLLLLLVLAFTGCHNKSSKLADFNRTVYTPEYASGFDIKGADGKKSVLVTVTNPWQGADSITTNLFIARDDEEVPADFTGQMLKGDAERIVCMSSTHIAMLDAIGETGRVVGVSGIDYISNPDIQARRDSVGDVGYEGNINYELLLSLDPDLVLLYGVNGASSMEGKLKELDIPFMYVGDYLEESPLGKAEWLVALSEVIGKRAEGEKVFAEIPVRYNVLKKKVADNILDAPSVMLNTPYGDSWFMPSTESYVAPRAARPREDIPPRTGRGRFRLLQATEIDALPFRHIVCHAGRPHPFPVSAGFGGGGSRRTARRCMGGFDGRRLPAGDGENYTEYPTD